PARGRARASEPWRRGRGGGAGAGLPGAAAPAEHARLLPTAPPDARAERGVGKRGGGRIRGQGRHRGEARWSARPAPPSGGDLPALLPAPVGADPELA